MLRTCHLFAGAGGGLLADLILGHMPVVAVEWDPYACAVLRLLSDGWNGPSGGPHQMCRQAAAAWIALGGPVSLNH